MLLECSGHPPEQPRQQIIFFDMHRRATFTSRSLDPVVLVQEAIPLYYNTDALPLQYCGG